MYPSGSVTFLVGCLVVGVGVLVFGFIGGHKTFTRSLVWYLLVLIILEIVVQVIYGQAIARVAKDLDQILLQGALMQKEAGKMILLVFFWAFLHFLGALFSPKK